MVLKDYFWYFSKALSPQVCDEIKKFALNKKKKELALTGGFKLKKNKKDIENMKKIRNSNLVWLNEKWLYNLLTPYVEIANTNAGWNFQFEKSEDIQFTIYNKNQYYDWHTDAGVDFPIYRKLSMTVQLSDPNDYEGGDLEFDLRNQTKSPTNIVNLPKLREQGTICVFPSFVWHRVTPIITGKRYSLVMWTYGQKFK
jgi:PKHD-type hydroxylase